MDTHQHTTICKNCGHLFVGNFCYHCGQPADTHRLTMHFIWHDIQHGILHFDNGIFYTIRQLLTRPGRTIREFIEGKRVRHYKPLSLVVVLATLYGVLYHYFIHKLFEVKHLTAEKDVVSASQKVYQLMTDHFAYATLIIIVNASIASHRVFKKQKYNFAEHLVLNTFYVGLVLVISLITLPVLFVYRNTEPVKWYPFVTLITNFLLMYWCYAQCFNKMSRIKCIGFTLLTYLLMSLMNLFIVYVIGLIVSSLG